MTTYRAGVIGHSGRGNYGHSLDTVYLGMEEIELVAVADADADGLTEAGERLGVGTAGCYSDYRRMLEQEELDIVSVAPRWLDQKCDMVIAAAASGVRGIFCEKPFARTAAEADAMIEACDRATALRSPSPTKAESTAISHKMKEMIADGVIGEIKEAHSAGKQDHRGGGQDLMVLGTHSLDMLCFLFGHPSWVQAYIRQDGHDAGPDDARQGDEEIGPIVGGPPAGYLRFRRRHHRHISPRGGRPFSPGRVPAASWSTGPRESSSTATATCSTAPIPTGRPPSTIPPGSSCSSRMISDSTR